MNPRTLIPASEFKARREARDTAASYRAMLERAVATRRFAIDGVWPCIGFAELGETAGSYVVDLETDDEPGAA